MFKEGFLVTVAQPQKKVFDFMLLHNLYLFIYFDFIFPVKENQTAGQHLSELKSTTDENRYHKNTYENIL